MFIMASDNVLFNKTVTATGRTEYIIRFGRGKVSKSPEGLYYLDLAANNGTMKLNLGLDALADLFSLGGHQESLTA